MTHVSLAACAPAFRRGAVFYQGPVRIYRIK